MTVPQLCKESAKEDFGFDPPALLLLPDTFPNVDSRTPKTMVLRERTSGMPSTSIPHITAVAALVIGSAALTVSTKAAEAP
eukprot:CAMPEP_0194230686 /NCGR_PEP_ID=MMETSP0156-20130528/44539_1 /TAXON_ID=33649 /ORGANISM="Thalassionema nitzschioides, Strain L26-B" /LENGTH=80 /DNA_ID=CAMNT_0038963281 /DNA_START=488 /DNA_END=730 /DNA_ORIENTATION=-